MFLAYLTKLIVCLALNTHNLTNKLFAILVHNLLDANKHNYNNCDNYYFLIFHKLKNWFQIVKGKCILGLERFRIFTVRFGFDSHTIDSIFFESVL